jgi:general stress protein YciG
LSENQKAPQVNGGGPGWHGDPRGHAEAGRKGGEKTASKPGHMAEIGRRGGSKLAQDRDYMATIGKKGGQRTAAKNKTLRRSEEDRVRTRIPVLLFV